MAGCKVAPPTPIPVAECRMAHTVRTGHSCGAQSPGSDKEPFRMGKSWLLRERRGISPAVKEAL